MVPVETVQQAGTNTFATPDHGQNPVIPAATSPSTENEIQELCAAYLASYETNDETIVDMRKDQGTAFVRALLRHHFPEPEGFHVCTAPFGSIISFPINFMIRGKEGTDADYVPLVPKDIAKMDKHGKRKAKSTLAKAQKAERDRQEAHERRASQVIKWHHVDLEHIVAFELRRKQTLGSDDGAEDGHHQLLTYLILVFDNATIFSRYVHMLNDVHYSNTLMTALTQRGGFEQGHGILLYGQLLEIFELVNGEAHVEKDTSMKLSTGDLGNGVIDLSIDMTKQPFESVNAVLKVFKKFLLREDKEIRCQRVEAEQDINTDGEVDDDVHVAPVTSVTDQEIQEPIMANV